MTSTIEAAGGSAERWGPLWGARPANWALSEDQQIPTYEEALRRVDLKPGQFVLDIGCGVGAFPEPGRRPRRAHAQSGSTPRRRCSKSHVSAARRLICGSATWRRSP